MSTIISTPQIRYILPSLLASLPAATASPQPPTALLPTLSPILRQRVKLLSANEPWISLLCYDPQNASKLSKVVQSDAFEPHPASGEVEVDWDGEVKLQYRRVDEETLQALVTMSELDLKVKLIWCVGDPEGGDGWRIGEVGAMDPIEDESWGCDTIGKAEDSFESRTIPQKRSAIDTSGSSSSWQHVSAPEEDDDDDYWAQYDQTPARTPGPHQSPPPQLNNRAPTTAMSAEDAYYAQYSEVQPAMDSYDPDEEAHNGEVESTLGKADVAEELRHELTSHPEFTNTSEPLYTVPPPLGFGQDFVRGRGDQDVAQRDLIQPRPSSSQSSNGSATVAHLERAAAAVSEGQSQSEIAVKQHIGYTIKSLFRLSKAAGIDRAEFERLVSMELELLSVGEESD